MYTAGVSTEFASGKRDIIARFVSTKGPERGSLRLTPGIYKRTSEVPGLGFIDDSTVAFLQFVNPAGVQVFTPRARLGVLHDFRGLDAVKLLSPRDASLPEFKRLHSAVELARWISTPQADAAIKHLVKHAPRNELLSYRPTRGTTLAALLSEMHQDLNDGAGVTNMLAYVYFYNELLRATAFTNEAERSEALNTIHAELDSLDTLPLCVALNTAVTSVLAGWEKATRIADQARRITANTHSPSVEPETGVLTFGEPGRVDADTCKFRAQDLIGSVASNGSDRPTVLYSGDPKFLRAYAPRLLFYMAAFPEFDYHFLVIASEVEASQFATDLLGLQEAISEFQRRPVSALSASHCEVPPDVSNTISFYASARFLFAQKHAMNFHQGLWIQDVDLFPDGDFAAHLPRIQEHDFSVVTSRSLAGIVPWKRFLAGSVFFMPSEATNEFLHAVDHYLRYWLTRGGHWMVDQNALAYAVHIVPSATCLDMSAARTPLRQSIVNSRIEGAV